MFLPYMGMAAILVMWPKPFEHTFVRLSKVGSTWNLASIGLAVIEEKKFENIKSERLGPRSVNVLNLWPHAQLVDLIC